MADVTIDGTKYGLQEPDLEGWLMILKAGGGTAFDKLWDAIDLARGLAAKNAEGIDREAVRALLPVLGAAPQAGKALLRACLMPPPGGPAPRATLSALAATLNGLVEQRVFDDLLALVKNVRGLARKASASSAPASGRDES